MRAAIRFSATARFLHAQEWRGRRYLVSPLVDFLLAGGAALLVFPLLFAFAPFDRAHPLSRQSIGLLSAGFAFLAYLVNDPHFMFSYQLFYRNFRQRIGGPRFGALWWRSVNAGIIVPAAMIAYFVWAFGWGGNAALGLAVQAMYFFVGWHYVKQSFGVFVVLSALKKVFYPARLRRLFLINCYLVWIYTWLPGQAIMPGFSGASQMNGVHYTSLQLPVPPVVIGFIHALVWLYGLACLGAIVWQAWRTEQRPSVTGLVGLSSMYLLLVLSWRHPYWAYMTPFLHSAQYLLFVFAYKRGESAVIAELSEDLREGPPPKLFSGRQFVLLAFFLGLLSFTMLPGALEKLTHGYGPLLFVFAFSVFINIHHYFIDNVIWKKENADVGQYLFHAPRRAPAG